MSGILDIAADLYHADQIADTPTLSRSIAHLLCTVSPAHAKAAHPKLNPDYRPDDDSKFDIGTAAHDLFLGGPNRIEIVEYDNWRTKDSQERKFQARVQGKIPLLAKDAGAVLEMVDALVRQLGEHSAAPPMFTEGKNEVTLTWEEPGGVVCRARLDALRDDFAAIDDLKTTSSVGGANPEKFSRSLYDNGYDLQAFAYSRAVEVALGHADVPVRFAVIETAPPYAMSVVQLGPAALTLAAKKWRYAVDVWRRCLDSGEWPAYSPRVAFADLPAWEESRWLAKEERELVA